MKILTFPNFLILLLVLLLVAFKGHEYTEEKLNQPTKLLSGIVSTGAELSQTVTEDGSSIYFARRVTDGNWDIFVTNKNGKGWSFPQKTSFSTPYLEADPFLAPDGDRLFFMSTRPVMANGEPQTAPDIWYVDRMGEDWSKPKFFKEINSETYGEGFMSLDQNGTIYFSSNRPNESHDIFYATLEGNHYSSPKPLEADLATSFSNPLISRGGNFLIFDSKEYQGYGSADLWITFKKKDGWTEPVNLGPEVNTDLSESAPFISADGRHLFFGRTQLTEDGFHSNIYQVHFLPILKKAKQEAGLW